MLIFWAWVTCGLCGSGQTVLNGQKLARIRLCLHGTCGIVQVFVRQTALQSVTMVCTTSDKQITEKMSGVVKVVNFKEFSRTNEIKYFLPPRGRGTSLYMALMGMYRRMGSHFHDWIDYFNRCTTMGLQIFGFFRVRQFFIFTVSKRTRMFVLSFPHTKKLVNS